MNPALIRSLHALSLTLTLTLTGAAGAAGTVVVADPYVRLAPPTAENTALFMVLHNNEAGERKLVSAASPAAKKVELHTVVHEGDVMRMRPVSEIAIPSQGETTLRPGGFHVMLLGLKAALREGDAVAVTLGFDDGSTQEIKAPVRRIGGHGEAR